MNIGPKLGFQGGTHIFLWDLYVSSTGEVFTLGQWRNVENRYLGVKFSIQGQTHYGWVRLNVTLISPQTIQAVITGYAYETIPNTPIIAGKTSRTDDDQPGSESLNFDQPNRPLSAR